MEKAGYSRPDARSPGVVSDGGDALVHRDGHRVAFLEEGRDGRGEYLVIEHVWTRPGMMAGPHWHPVLTETFRVREGRMRFRVDGREFVLGPGGCVTVRPGEGHGFRRPVSIRRGVEVELSFYLETLGLTHGKSDAPLATDDAIAASSSNQRQGR